MSPRLERPLTQLAVIPEWSVHHRELSGDEATPSDDTLVPRPCGIIIWYIIALKVLVDAASAKG